VQVALFGPIWKGSYSLAMLIRFPRNVQFDGDSTYGINIHDTLYMRIIPQTIVGFAGQLSVVGNWSSMLTFIDL